MTKPPKQQDVPAIALRKVGPSAPFAIQPPFFFGKRFLAAAKRVRANSRSSLPSQNSMSSLARETKCSIWELRRRPRRRHISSSSALCSSDMRMLYRRFFFATHKPCQSKRINTWRKRVDKGRHWPNSQRSVSETSQEMSGRNEEIYGRISPGKMNSLDSTAGANGGPSSHWQTTKKLHYIGLSCPFFRLIHSSRTCTETTAIPSFAVLRCGYSTFMN